MKKKSNDPKKIGEKWRIAGNLASRTSRTSYDWTLVSRIEGVGQPGEAGKIEGLNKQRKNKKPLLSQYKLSKLFILPLKLEFSSPHHKPYLTSNIPVYPDV